MDIAYSVVFLTFTCENYINLCPKALCNKGCNKYTDMLTKLIEFSLILAFLICHTELPDSQILIVKPKSSPKPKSQIQVQNPGPNSKSPNPKSKVQRKGTGTGADIKILQAATPPHHHP